MQARANYWNAKKLYISRSKLPENFRSFEEEKEFEENLKTKGWEIFHPENYSIAEQLNHYESSNFICSTAGSAIHLLFGINTNNIFRFILLTPNGDLGANYERQFNAQNIQHTKIVCLKQSHSCQKSGVNKNMVLSSDYSIITLANKIERLSPMSL